SQLRPMLVSNNTMKRAPKIPNETKIEPTAIVIARCFRRGGSGYFLTYDTRRSAPRCSPLAPTRMIAAPKSITMMIGGHTANVCMQQFTPSLCESPVNWREQSFSPQLSQNRPIGEKGIFHQSFFWTVNIYYDVIPATWKR